MRTAIASLFLLAVVGIAADPPSDPIRDQVLKLNKEITNEDSANTKLKELNKDKVNTPKLVKVAAKELKDAKSGAKPFRFYPAMVLAKAAHNAKEYDAAEAFYQFCVDNAINDLKTGKLIVLACQSQIDFFLSRKQYAKAIKACERFLKEEDDESQSQAIFVLEKKLRAMIRNGETDAAMDEMNNLLRGGRRNNVFLISMKASLQREAGKLDEALETYKGALDKLQGDESIPEEAKKFFTNTLRYSLSGVYSELNKLDESCAELEALIKANPDTATYKNDLGFVLADNDKELGKAEKLIREAVELDLKANKKLADEGKLDPEFAKKANTAYVDSLGWVLYKQKKYDEALKHLLESAGSGDEESDHIEIWDHVGDCYAALGKKKEALESYQKGLKMEDFTKKDAERRRKVTEKINKLKKELK